MLKICSTPIDRIRSRNQRTRTPRPLQFPGRRSQVEASHFSSHSCLGAVVSVLGETVEGMTLTLGHARVSTSRTWMFGVSRATSYRYLAELNSQPGAMP